MSGNAHARFGVGENPEVSSPKDYLSLYSIVNKFPIFIKPIKEKFVICYLALITKNKKQFNKEIQAFMSVFHEQFGSSYFPINF